MQLPIKMYDVGVKNTAVYMYRNHFRSLRKVARYTNTSKSTVHRWLSSHPATRHRPPSFRKVSEVVRRCIQAAIEVDPFVTLEQLRTRVAQDAKVQLSTSTICCCLKALQITRKRTYSRAPNTAELAAARAAFSEKIRALSIDCHEVLSIDETCFYFHMRPRHGRALRGRRIGVSCHAKRHSKVTLILAVSSQGIAHWEILSGSANTESFAGFISRLPPLPHHRFALFDNASFHKTAAVERAVRAVGLEPLRTPPYTPEWNPVERAFSVLKAAYRRARRASLHDDARPAFDVIHETLEECFDQLLDTYDLEPTFRSCWAAALAGIPESAATVL